MAIAFHPAYTVCTLIARDPTIQHFDFDFDHGLMVLFCHRGLPVNGSLLNLESHDHILGCMDDPPAICLL